MGRLTAMDVHFGAVNPHGDGKYNFSCSVRRRRLPRTYPLAREKESAPVNRNKPSPWGLWKMGLVDTIRELHPVK